jgi:hypothetical protein
MLPDRSREQHGEWSRIELTKEGVRESKVEEQPQGQAYRVILMFLPKPKQLIPAFRRSTRSIGSTLREGNPGYGIFVPGMSSGLNDTVDVL